MKTRATTITIAMIITLISYQCYRKWNRKIVGKEQL